jgi:dTDP-4-dehydrorhamnose 3,5-epimerase-like enzyme
MPKAKLLHFSTLSDERGKLGFIQGNKDIPFDIKRIYYLYDVPLGCERGAHGHKELQQIILPLSGSFTVCLDDGRKKESFLLNDPGTGLYVPKMMWRDLKNFSRESVCLVLASQEYTEDDYYRTYQDFLDAARTLHP